MLLILIGLVMALAVLSYRAFFGEAPAHDLMVVSARSASVDKSADERRIPLSPGDVIGITDVVRTDIDGTAALQYGNGAHSCSASRPRCASSMQTTRVYGSRWMRGRSRRASSRRPAARRVEQGTVGSSFRCRLYGDGWPTRNCPPRPAKRTEGLGNRRSRGLVAGEALHTNGGRGSVIGPFPIVYCSMWTGLRPRSRV